MVSQPKGAYMANAPDVFDVVAIRAITSLSVFLRILHPRPPFCVVSEA
jgi:hypothetical protein